MGAAGAGQQTTDLAAVVQEIVDQGGWSASNSMAFLISGSGLRTAEAYDGEPLAAPKLEIVYATPPPDALQRASVPCRR